MTETITTSTVLPADDKFRVAKRSDSIKRMIDNEHLLPRNVAETVAMAAQISIEEMKCSSKLLHTSDAEQGEKDVAPFLKREVVLGERLASGGFSDVYEVKSFHEDRVHRKSLNSSEESARAKILAELSGSDSSDSSDDEHDHGRKYNGKHQAHANKFVVKHLRPHLLERPETFRVGAVDLGREAQILASIRHPNIVNIRGWSSHGTNGYTSGLHDGYFLILDRLYETLEDQIKVWRKQVSRLNLTAPVSAALRRKQLMADRLKVCADIAGALEYLHKRQLIYRDLKPANLAFDIQGNIQLFDFGLAKEIVDAREEDGENDTYELTGGTGSMRYMAPEVAHCRSYNLKADVYGFAMVTYETLALRKPFEGFTPGMMQKLVFGEEGHRPTIHPLEKELPGNSVLQLIQNGWSEEVARRPTMEEAHHILRNALTAQYAAAGLSRQMMPRRASRRSSFLGAKQMSMTSVSQGSAQPITDDQKIGRLKQQGGLVKSFRRMSRRSSCKF